MKSNPDQTKLCFKFPLFSLFRFSLALVCWCDVLDVDQAVVEAWLAVPGARVMGPGCNHHQISPDQQSAATGYTGHIRYVSRG